MCILSYCQGRLETDYPRWLWGVNLGVEVAERTQKCLNIGIFFVSKNLNKGFSSQATTGLLLLDTSICIMENAQNVYCIKQLAYIFSQIVQSFPSFCLAYK